MPWRQVEQRGAGQGQLSEALDAGIGHDLAAERAQMSRQSVGDVLGTAARQRPADRMAHQAEHEPKGRRRHFLQRQYRVRRQAGEQGASRFASKPTPRQPGRRAESVEAEPGKLKRMPWQVQQRLQKLNRQIFPVLKQRDH